MLNLLMFWEEVMKKTDMREAENNLKILIEYYKLRTASVKYLLRIKKNKFNIKNLIKSYLK